MATSTGMGDEPAPGPDDISATSWVVAGGRPHGPGDPSNVGMTPASAFRHGDPRVYAREGGTPGWEAFEAVVAGLEHGQAVAFSSGMAAVAAVLDDVPPGGLVVVPDDCYQGVARLVASREERGRFRIRRLPTAATAAWLDALEAASLVWLESPSNPLMELADVPTICAADRPGDCVVVVDNTFATPLNQRPLDLGADVVVHAATKFLGGHSDLLAGVVVARPDRAEHLRWTRATTGATPGTLEMFLALRGVRTLALRLRAAEATAAVLARRLADHAEVTRVRWPGLAEDPGHDVAARTLAGFGAMMSFEVTGGADRANAMCEATRLVRHATSLGGIESSMERRGGHAGQEHLPPSLVRLSVGCEDAEDLWADLAGALDASA